MIIRQKCNMSPVSNIHSLFSISSRLLRLHRLVIVFMVHSLPENILNYYCTDEGVSGLPGCVHHGHNAGLGLLPEVSQSLCPGVVDA